MNTFLTSDSVNKALSRFAGANHPLSLGYSAYLLSDSPYVLEEYRCDISTIREFYRISESQRPMAGSHSVFSKDRKLVICISERGIPFSRFIELVVHECTHLVDAMFERCCLNNIDTELRAYYLDWFVGNLLEQTVANTLDVIDKESVDVAHKFGPIFENKS